MDPEEARQLLLEALREGRIRHDGIPADIRSQLFRDEPNIGERVRGIGEQVLAGLGEVLPTLAVGVSKIPGTPGAARRGGEQLGELLAKRRQETAPDVGGEGTARFLGRVAGEGALGFAGGAAIRGAGIAARGAHLASDILTGVGISQAGPEESVVGAAGALTGSERLTEAAENPLVRALGEVGTVLGVDSLIRGAARRFGKDAAVAADRRTPTPDNDARRQRIIEIDDELHKLAKSSYEINYERSIGPDGKPDLIKYNSILTELREKGVSKKFSSRPMTAAERTRWKELEAERAELVNAGSPAAQAVDALDATPAGPEILANSKGVLVRETVGPATEARKAARDAFGDKQSVFPGDDIREGSTFGDWIRSRYLKYVDIDKPYEWTSVPGLLPAEDPAILARTRRRSGAAAMRNWTDGLRKLGLDEDPRTMSPEQIINDLAGGDVNSLGYTMLALREQETRGRGLGKRLSDKQMDAGLRLYRDDPGIRSAVKGFQDYANKWLDMLEEEGVISVGAASRIRKAGNHWYTPLRDADDETKKLFQTIPGLGDPLKALREVGEGVSYINPVVGWAQLTFELTDLVARKRLHRSLAHIGDESLNTRMIKKVHELPDGAKVQEADRQTLIKNFLGDDSGDQTYKAGDHFFFRFRNEDGSDSFYRIDKFLYESLRQFDPAQVTNAFARTLIAPGRALRAGVTVTPAFAGANIFRDSLFRAMAEPAVAKGGKGVFALDEALSGGVRAIDELTREALNRIGLTNLAEDPGIRAFELSGGSMSTLADMDLNRLVKVLDDMRKSTPGYASKMYRLQHWVRNVGHDVRVAGSVAENTNRLDTFKRVREQSLAEGMDELNANLLAAYRAGESTVDFSRRGRAFEESGLVRALDEGTAFWRATLQSWDRVARLFGDIERDGLSVNTEGIKQVAATGSVLTGMALLNYAKNRENPDYYNIRKDIRSRYVLVDLGPEARTIERFLQKYIGDDNESPILAGGESLFLKTPVPHELGWLFMTGPVRALEEIDPANPYHQDNNVARIFAEAGDPIGEGLYELFGPVNPLSSSFGGTGVSTIAQLVTNKDRFRDVPIEPEFARLEGLPPSLRARGTESGGARVISETLAGLGADIVSPGQVEFMTRNIGGGTGSFILDVLGAVYPDPEDTALAEKGPLRRFFVDERGGGSAGEAFYDEYFRLRSKVEASKDYEDSGRPGAASKVLQDLGSEDIQRYNLMDVLYQQLRSMNEAVEFIQNNEALSDGEKRKINDQIRAEANLILKAANAHPDHLETLIEQDENPERRVLVQSLLDGLKEEKRQRTSIRRRVQ